MNVSLTPQLEELVQKKVASGRYGSASEVIREGLRLLEEQDKARELWLAELRKEIAKGIEQLDRGESSRFDPEQIKSEGRKRLGRRRSK